jgi:hypothetical protein
MVGIPARANTHTVIGNPIVLGRVRHLEPIFGLHRHVRADFIHLHRPHPFRVHAPLTADFPFAETVVAVLSGFFLPRVPVLGWTAAVPLVTP